jgi:hypothetical protein
MKKKYMQWMKRAYSRLAVGLVALTLVPLSLIAQISPCDGLVSDWGYCYGDIVTVSAFGFPQGIGPYQYTWAGATFLSGQGTSQVQFIANGANPQTIFCTRYDIGMNCTGSMDVSYRNALPPYYTFNPAIPACPDTNAIDTFSLFWATATQNGACVDVAWQAIGGTILNQFRTNNGQSARYDTVVVQWNGFGNHGLHAVFEVHLSGFGIGLCYFPKEFWPIGGGVVISGPVNACDTNTIQTYSVFNTPGYLYNWTAVNGTILSGQGTTSVTVKWHGSGTISATKTDTSCTSVYTDALNFQAFLSSFSLGPDVGICSDDSITLYGPQGWAQYNWSNGSLYDHTTVSAPGTYSLTARDNWGCLRSDDILVTALDCVFPGDANDDGVADNQDVLTIGADGGRIGTSRANASLNWVGQPSTDWGNPLPGTADPKHSDCDGNGSVTAVDTVAVTLNYGQTHTKTEGVTLNGPDLRVQALQDSVVPGDLAWFAVTLGTAQEPMDSIYGLAFTLNYSTNAADSLGLVHVDYGNCWFAGSGSRINFTYPHPGAAGVDVAVVRNDQAEQAGYGEVLRLAILTDSNLAAQQAYLSAWINNVHVVDEGLEPIGVELFRDSALVTPLPAVGYDDPVAWGSELKPKLYPNPAGEWVNVEQTGGKVKQVEVYDLSGKQLLVRQGGKTLMTIPTAGLSDGVYWMRILAGKGTYVEKLVIQRQ